MRRTLLFIALIFLLALSPIGAMAHAYQHYDSANPDPFHAKHESGVPCGLCAAYLALEHAVAGPQALPPIAGTATPPSPERTRGTVARPFFNFLQRAPPALL